MKSSSDHLIGNMEVNNCLKSLFLIQIGYYARLASNKFEIGFEKPFVTGQKLEVEEMLNILIVQFRQFTSVEEIFLFRNFSLEIKCGKEELLATKDHIYGGKRIIYINCSRRKIWTEWASSMLPPWRTYPLVFWKIICNQRSVRTRKRFLSFLWKKVMAYSLNWGGFAVELLSF